MPANTYIATILAITENNLKPVLVEPRIDTFQIDDTRIEEAITPRTRAIMIVHLYGKCAYTDRIGDICRRHNLRLIEDNAQGSRLPFRQPTHRIAWRCGCSQFLPRQESRRIGTTAEL